VLEWVKHGRMHNSKQLRMHFAAWQVNLLSSSFLSHNSVFEKIIFFFVIVILLFFCFFCAMLMNVELNICMV
jgi:small-conductance mechanosensitive channel